MMKDPQQIKAMMTAVIVPMLKDFGDDDLRDFRAFVTDAINDELVRRRVEHSLNVIDDRRTLE